MNIPRGFIRQAANLAVLFSLLLLLAKTGLGQGGPPPLPPIPLQTLDFWPLEEPNWGDWFGDPARGFANLNAAPSWDYTGTALSVDTNVAAYLQQYVYQDGWTNIVFDSGSISLWFQPNWTSVTDGGTGLTNWGVVLSVGNWTSNAAESAWTLAISPAGTNLVMEAQSAGSNQLVFDVPIDFDAGDWHSMTVTYQATNCCVYLEGQFVTNAGPIQYQPTYDDCLNCGMFFGSFSTSGAYQCHGQLQWLATYDSPLSADAVASDYASVSSYITYFGGSLPSGGGFHREGSGPPAPPGGGGTNSGGGPLVTNVYPIYTTNQFWLKALPLGTNAFNSNSNAVTFILYGTTNTASYQLQTMPSLTGTNWTPQQIFVGASGHDWTPITFSMSGQTTLFFRAINYS
jgi:hypothetical protein